MPKISDFPTGQTSADIYVTDGGGAFPFDNADDIIFIPSDKVGGLNDFFIALKKSDGQYELACRFESISGGTPKTTFYGDVNISGQIGVDTSNIDSQDLDTIVDNGRYSGSTLTNAPGGDTGAWFLIVTAHPSDSNYVFQTAVDQDTAGDPTIWNRTRVGGTWGTWALPTPTNIDADTLQGNNSAYFLDRTNHTGTQALATITGHDKAAHDALGIAAATAGDADTVDGIQGAELVQRDGSVPMTGDLDLGGNDLTNIGALEPLVPMTDITTYVNSWADYEQDTWGPGRYMKDACGMVHLFGLVKSGSENAAMFTLPVGCRPGTLSTQKLIFNQKVSSGYHRVEVHNDGTVFMSTEGAGSPTGWTSLSGISFYAES